MQSTCLASRGQHAFTTQDKPVLDGSSGIFAAAHSDHYDGEEKEKASHGEAHAVHRLVADNDVTVHLVRYAWYTGATNTETRYLRGQEQTKPITDGGWGKRIF